MVRAGIQRGPQSAVVPVYKRQTVRLRRSGWSDHRFWRVLRYDRACQPPVQNERTMERPPMGAGLGTAACISRLPCARAPVAARIPARISAMTGPRREPGGAWTTGRGVTRDERCTSSFGAADARGSRAAYLRSRSVQTPHDGGTQYKHEHDGEDGYETNDVVTGQ